MYNLYGNEPLFKASGKVETRWASPENIDAGKGNAAKAENGRKGSPYFPLKAGESRILAEEQNVSGMIRRIWITISEQNITMLRGIKLDFYWDGALKPAVSAPIGDFFGHGLGRMATYQTALFTSPEGRSFNCYVPMPFRKGMKIKITNESNEDLRALFYDVDYTVGDELDEDVLYFHAHYRRENPTIMQKDYEILPQVSGKGRYIGCNIGVNVDEDLYYKAWWGEGEVKMYIDGDKDYPTLCGTGTEDYIGTGWGQGRYDNLFQGCTVADEENMQYCLYRYHIPDPVYFKKNIKVTIQQIGNWDPKSKMQLYYGKKTVYSKTMEPIDLSPDGGTDQFGHFERYDDWSSCCYFYLNSPENDLPEIDPVELRVK